ncbi:hypothetical protein QBC44DRAFT_325431 [Cladorrhinum sp. PSN332]|nr:hypothetical protein QBC44DRAFT_325431 [Cladorrhinum sp. PSN332]
MSPEKAISSGRESPVTTKEPATPEKQTLGSLDPSIVAEGNVVTQFSQEDIRSEQGYSATVIHRPERQNNYRRVQSLWVMANTNHQQPQQVTHNEPAAKKYKNKRSNNSGSRPSTPIDPENKVEAAIAQNRQQAPATKGYRANAGGSLKMTKNRNGLAIDTRRSQDQLVPAAEKLNKNEVKTESGASLTVDVHLQHRVSESSILTGRSYHSAKSTFSSPNSNPDSADGQPFVSAPQTPMEFNGNPSPALTAIPAERCQLTPRASPESLRVDDSTPKPAAASKDKTGEPVITQALEEKTSRNAKSDSSSSNKPDEKKPASRPPSRAEGRRFKSSNKGEGQKPQSANKTENKPRPSTPVQPTAREAQHEKTVEPKPREKMNPATSTQSSTKEVQEKKPEKAKPTASTQSSSKTEEKKAGAPADARPAAKAQESKPEASVNAQPGNNSKKKKSQAARKTDAQSADSAEGKEGSLNDTKADDVKPGQVHDKSNKAENKPNKIADKPTEAVEKSKPSSFSAATQPAEPPLSSSPQTSPMKKNKKAIKKRNMARKKLHEASVASVPGAA